MFVFSSVVDRVIGSPLRSVEAVTRENMSEMGLTQASKFGFMIETCILAARNDECLVCPAHKAHPLTIRDIAPDIVRQSSLDGEHRKIIKWMFSLSQIFADLPAEYILDPRCVDKGKYVAEGAFGEIYRGAVYPSPTATVS